MIRWAVALLLLLTLASPAQAYGIARDYRHNQVASNVSPGAGHGSGWQGFSPTWIPSSVLWLDPTAGLTKSTGISQWTDRIASRAYVQATGSKQPTLTTVNGAPSLRFTSANTQGLATAGWVLAQPLDIFIVAQLASTPAGQFAFADVSTSSEVACYFQGDSTTLRLFAGGSVTGTVTDATATLAVYRWSVNNASSAIYANGKQVGTGTAGSNAAGIANVGQNFSAGSNLNGWISAVVETAGILDAGSASRLTRYFGNLYGIAVAP